MRDAATSGITAVLVQVDAEVSHSDATMVNASSFTEGRLNMSYRSILMMVAAIGAAGCASGPPFIDQMQPEAVSMATRRGQFEMACPAATGEMLSRETVQPVVNTIRFQGITRAEYTVGVSGCGKRATYVVMCPDNGSGCFAAGGRTEVR
jgi:hypothetical protein